MHPNCMSLPSRVALYLLNGVPRAEKARRNGGARHLGLHEVPVFEAGKHRFTQP